MAHSHQHGHSHGNFEENRQGNKKGLLIALIITTLIMLLEFFGGLFTNSLALLADAGHMLSDASSLFLSLIAIWFASKKVSKKKTYGFYRFEILAALFNGVTLFVITGFILIEAYERFIEPPPVASGTMMIIASIGLMANLLSAWFLMRNGDVKENVNLRSAYLHVIGDALGSLGAIAAGTVMLVSDWYLADPLISVFVSLLILKSAWGIVKQSVHILMEGTPQAIETDVLKKELLKIDGVIDVHDLHIWTITSGLDILSCHLKIQDDCDEQLILKTSTKFIQQNYHIDHTTIQLEKSGFQHGELKV
ncbi:cation transporter [Chryseomicrobium excrementi]|uniref:Cation transporter n=1 Tax=Chryseomicrobium excrementi TaxID=2041346 RepID=A0A2M9EZC0_9BACL|nr:cation diffusion facilitator family transporter [Chryseomicrobium excrementi]PJK16561.1 cation transporter [Chryseomicrobium excrementi]